MDFAAHRITVNAADVTVQSLYGRPHLVAPVVLVKEKVLNGGFLPAEEIRKSEPAWNSVAVTANHPQEGGEFVHAATPERVDEYKFGEVYNSEYVDDERSLRGELWLDIQRALALGGDAQDTIARLAQHVDDVPDDIASLEAAGDGMLEVSTGYWFDAQESVGSHDGESYSAQQQAIIPDHLAALPNATGKCSVEDGCGAPRVSANQSEGDRVRWDDSDGNTTYGIVVDTLDDDTNMVLVAVYTPDSDDGEWTTDDETRRVSTDSLSVIEQFPPISSVNSDDDAQSMLERGFELMRAAFNGTRGTGTKEYGTNAGNDGHDCGCGCGGTGACENSTTMELEDLAEQTAFSVEQLRDMNDEQRETVVRGVSANADDDGDGDGDPTPDDDNDSPNPQDDDTDNGGVDVDSEEFNEAVARAVSEALTANQQEQQREDAIRTIVSNSSKSRDELDDLDTNALVNMAEVVGERQQANPLMGANYAGRGVPSTSSGNDDEDLVQKYSSITSMAANAAKQEDN